MPIPPKVPEVVSLWTVKCHTYRFLFIDPGWLVIEIKIKKLTLILFPFFFWRINLFGHFCVFIRGGIFISVFWIRKYSYPLITISVSSPKHHSLLMSFVHMLCWEGACVLTFKCAVVGSAQSWCLITESITISFLD